MLADGNIRNNRQKSSSILQKSIRKHMLISYSVFALFFKAPWRVKKRNKAKKPLIQGPNQSQRCSLNICCVTLSMIIVTNIYCLLCVTDAVLSSMCMHAHWVSSAVSNSVILWTVACQDPLPMGFCRQEYWGELPYHLLGDLPNLGIKSVSHISCAGSSLPPAPNRKPPLSSIDAFISFIPHHNFRSGISTYHFSKDETETERG